MIVEYIRYVVPSEDDGRGLVAAYAVAGESLRASPHCLGFDLARCAEASTCFILRIQWDSAEGHLKGFRASPLFPPFLAAIRPYVGMIEEMRHYEPTEVRWSAG